MTKRKEVSEKSLELNVCAELLLRIRLRPGWDGAVWLGMTQRQERRNGLDEMITNAPGISLMLQFKSPWANSIDDYLYRFSINRKQHRTLEKLSNQYPTSVYYVFPLYSKWAKVRRYAPILARDTWLIPVSCISLDPSYPYANPSICLTKGRSGISVAGNFLEATCEPINAVELLSERNMDQRISDRVFGIPSNSLRDWVEEWDNFGLRFFGLNALYVPN